MRSCQDSLEGRRGQRSPGRSAPRAAAQPAECRAWLRTQPRDPSHDSVTERNARVKHGVARGEQPSCRGRGAAPPAPGRHAGSRHARLSRRRGPRRAELVRDGLPPAPHAGVCCTRSGPRAPRGSRACSTTPTPSRPRTAPWNFWRDFSARIPEHMAVGRAAGVGWSDRVRPRRSRRASRRWACSRPGRLRAAG